MAYRNVVCDWNGTLFGPPTAEGMNKAIAYAALRDDLAHGRLGDAWKLLAARRELKANKAAYDAGRCDIADVYEVFNEGVVEGRPVALVDAVVERYARRTARQIDQRAVRSLRVARGRGLRTAVLSTCYRHSILAGLAAAKADDIFDGQDVVAHRLLRDEKDSTKAFGFTLELYGRKAGALREEFLEKRDFEPEETIFMGDTEEDLAVISVIPPENFVVSLLASDEFKTLASRNGAFVPEDEADLRNKLQVTE